MDSASFGELDDLEFLRDVDLFADTSEDVIRAISVQARTELYSSGAMVVRRTDPGDSMFVVKQGVVEVVNPSSPGGDDTPALAYLGRGECFGELALLTGASRHADVRVPEQAELLVIDRDLFEELMENNPGFARQLAVILAHRLVNLLQNLPMSGDRKELQGSLRNFDLATVVQTLISSGQTGVMTLSRADQPVAQLSFRNGNIFRAAYEHRTGDEAVHHLFQVQHAGDFHFTSTKPNDSQDSPDPGITVPAMALMMDSVRLEDELKVLRESLPPEETRLVRSTDRLSLSLLEETDKAEGQALWARLERPAPVRDLLDRSPRCHYHAARALMGLLDSKQIGPTSEGGS